MIRSLLVFSVLIVLTDGTSAQTFRSKINTGNDKYHEENYDQALNNYQDALLDDPRNKIAQFNQGDALYKMEKYDKALEVYQSALGGDDLKLEAESHFNIGNSFFKQNKLPESIEAYKKVLDINPDDRDAKYNLELARAKLKEMADKQQQNPQASPQAQQQQGEQQNNEGQSEGEEENQQQDQQQQGEQENNAEEEQQQEQEQQQPAEQDETKMTKEDAERILDALKNDEKDKQEMRKPKRVNKRTTDKDW